MKQLKIENIAILKYNFLWDEIPFINLLYVNNEFQNQGYGTKLLHQFEQQMKQENYTYIITSTRQQETAQHFFRKQGYKDIGHISLPSQPDLELFLIKQL